MSGISFNPEFVRYARAQLRASKLLATAIVCLALSLTVGVFYLHSPSFERAGQQAAGTALLKIAFILQALVLAGGGGIACLNSIYSEKEQHTFDYQRMTRLTPTELALGKLFGAPLLMYFICLCLMPLTIYSAIIARARPSFVLAAYVVLVVASVTFHTFTLLFSLLAVRGSQISGIVLALLVLWLVSGDFAGGFLHVHSIGPFASADFASASSWKTGLIYRAGQFTDVFWGHSLHHFPVLIGIDLLLASWFLLGVVRNVKKDPQYYEVYSPLQFLGFALFLNFLFVGFYDASWATPLDAQSLLFTFDVVIFALLGMTLLRNRERLRSLLRCPAGRVNDWWDALWPAPVLGLGTVLVGVLIISGLNNAHSPTGNWSLGFAILRCLFFTLWTVRDIQFLQWMNLRPGKHPLVLAVLYLSTYYICASVLLSAFGSFRFPPNMPAGSLFVPSAMFLLEPKTWEEGPNVWAAGLGIQVALIGWFFYLQMRRIRQLKGSLSTATAGTPWQGTAGLS